MNTGQKNKDTRLVNFNVNIKEYEALKEIAKKNERTISGQLRLMIRLALKEYSDEDSNT